MGEAKEAVNKMKGELAIKNQELAAASVEAEVGGCSGGGRGGGRGVAAICGLAAQGCWVAAVAHALWSR